MARAEVQTQVDARVDGLRGLLADAALDAMVVTSDAGIAYLSGFHGLQLERLFAVVVGATEGGALVVPRLDEEAAEAAPTALERVTYDASSNGLPELLARLGGRRRVGVEERNLSFARSTALAEAGHEVTAAEELLMALRSRKEAREVERIRSACGLIADALQAMFDSLHPGDVERVVNADVEYRLRRVGANDVHSLILFGPNAAKPHAEPGDRPLEVGDVVCADVSACLDGYWGDLTRCGTVGAPSSWAREACQVVHEAQAAAIAATRLTLEAREVDAAQRRIVEGAAQLGRCLHGAGHAIGLEVHEPPFLVPGNEDPLREGMVFTIEPGIYKAGVGGIRLEDDVLVTAGEPEVLSTLPLELREIPAG
jgi:Xaa-Pro dipeptidase